MDVILLSSQQSVMFEADKINQMFAAGLDYLILRKPQASSTNVAELLTDIHPQYYPRIFLHKHYLLAARMKLGGVHISREDKYGIAFRLFTLRILKLIHPSIQICATVSNLRTLKRQPRFVDFVLLSGLFDRNRPYEFTKGVDEEDIKERLSQTTRQVYAYGNIGDENISIVKALHMDGFALGSAVWKSPEPIRKLKHYLQLAEEGEINLRIRTLRQAK